MTRQSKTYSHIWDNVMGGVKAPFRAPQKDTTGSSATTFSFVEYSREEVLVSSAPRAPTAPRAPRHYPEYPPKVFFVGGQSKTEKRSKNDGFVTNRERELAEPPKPLAPWKFEPEVAQKYEPHAVCHAFEQYSRRLAAKKHKLEQEKEQKLALAAQKYHEKRDLTIQKERKSRKTTCLNGAEKKTDRVTTRRNDEVRIDAYMEKTEMNEEVVVTSEGKPRRKQKTLPTPGFYGTIEAEKCAEQAAAHISKASENLERLHFVAEDVFPDTKRHLKKLKEIGNDVKDFNQQLRSRRVKVPTRTGATKCAHFIITDSGSE